MQETEMNNPTEFPQVEALILDAEGRAMRDRRSSPTPFLSRYALFGGRRRGGRRDGERRDVFVDLFSEHIFLVAILIVALNMLDAFFTLLLLSHGGEEANPVALWLLNVGPWAFILAKTIGIGLCTILLVIA